MSNKMKNMRAALLFCLVAMISLSVSAQNVTVTGTVTDKTGETVIGASVVQKGNTSNGTITDIDGNFSLSVPANSTLVFSYVGMTSQEIPLKGKTKVEVVMEDDAQALEEVVVIGYGTVQKKDLTGSVSSVSAKQLESIPVSSASEALQGKMAGVQITTTEGSPDAEVKIRVRGGGSLSQDNSPLYIVDGFPVSSISDIAPTDIQSVDVLKDASSTAIYGARGANGVIIITTKSGSEGKTQVNFGASYGFRNVIKQVGVLDPYEFSLYQYELDQTGTSYGAYKDLEIYKSIEGSNWQDQLFGRTGNQQQYNISVSGGTKSTKFNISYARNDEKSIMRGSGYSKNNINAKINTEINKWLSLDFNARLIQQKIDGLNGGADNESSKAYSLVARAITHAPVKALNEDSEDDENSTNARYTPLERIDATYKQQRRFRQDYNVGVNWEPFKGLKFRSEFGYGWKFDDTDQVWGYKATANSKFGHGGLPQAYLTNSDNKNWRNANTLTYENKKLFNGRDRINVMIGHEVSTSQDTKKYVTAVDFSKDATTKEILAALGNGTALPTSTYIGIKDNLLSFFGRANYTMMDKYLFTFTMRADGSSKFAKGNQWGYFPSGAVAWRIFDEPFMNNTKEWLSNLKVRASYGTSGNNRIPSGSMYTTYSVAGTSDKGIYFDETTAIVLKHGNVLSNPSLKWETTISRNAGIDFGFFNNRLSGSFDYFVRYTYDMIGPAPELSSLLGTSVPKINNSDMKSYGFELEVNWRDRIGEVSYGAKFVLSDDQQKILRYPNDSYDVGSYYKGEHLNDIWGLTTIGIAKSQEEMDAHLAKVDQSSVGTNWGVGDIMYADLDGDGKISNGTNKLGDTGDYRIIGNSTPRFKYGITLDAAWKGFDFSIFMQGIGKRDLWLDGCYFWGANGQGNEWQSTGFAEHWDFFRPEGDPLGANLNSYYPRVNFSGDRNTKVQTRYLQNGAYLRLKNVQLGYTLPRVWTEKAGISSVRVYVSGDNLATITSLSKIFDPEATGSLAGTGSGKLYPLQRVISVGVNVNF